MSLARLPKTYRDPLWDYLDAYKREHPGPVKMCDVAAWLIDHRLWEPPRRSKIRQLAKELADAARAKRITDPQGRKVRAMHAVKAKRVDANGNLLLDVVWDHIREMSLEYATASFTQRHGNIAGQCRAHHRDVQSFNENNPNARQVQLEFDYDFTNEVQGREQQILDKIPQSGDKPRPKPR